MSRQAKLKLYEIATPLVEAWREFASPENATKIEQMPGFWDTFTQKAQSQIESFSQLGAAAQAGLKARQDRTALILEMREKVLDDLFNSELIALGIRQRPSKSHYPVNIDPDIFEFAQPKWEQSTVEWEGKLYTGVKVYDPQTVPAALPKGSITAIDRTINELKCTNLNFCNLPRQQACQLIRERLETSEISGNGMSDKNLSKRILLYCPKRGISN